MRIVLFLLGLVHIVWAQSGTVSNAADFQLGGLFASGPVIGPTALAPGSLAIINNFSSISSPVTSATVSVRPVGSASSIPAQVTAVDSSTITFVLPSAPAGPAQLIYRPAGGVTNWIEIKIVPASFALFRSGFAGPVRAQQISPDGSVTANGLASPITAGQAVVIWGSGLGGTPAGGVSVALGGVSQTVLYAGHSPTVAGVDQINFRVSSDAPDGCYVPLTVTYGAGSTTSFLSKSSDGGPCIHPFGFTAAELRNLDAGVFVNIGHIYMDSELSVVSSGHASRQESASVGIGLENAVQVASYFSPAPTAQGCSLPALGPTTIVVRNGDFSYISAPDFGSRMTLMTGSTSLFLTPPSGSIIPAFTYAATFPDPVDAPFGALAPPLLKGGQWTWLASTYSFAFVNPQPIQIAGSAVLTLGRTKDQTITWDGSTYDSHATLSLTLTGANTTLLTCTAAAQAGTLTIPKNLLAQLNPGAAMLRAEVNESPVGAFTHFALPGGSTFVLTSSPSSSDTRPVDIQ